LQNVNYEGREDKKDAWVSVAFLRDESLGYIDIEKGKFCSC
jgi:hypothetical protein